nr:aldehyde dehydrogenase family protein [Novosphingobium marinum]
MRIHQLYYGGRWHEAIGGGRQLSHNPASGDLIGEVAEATREDVDRAVTAAVAGFRVWREVPPLERARLLREMATIIRRNGKELADLDALDCGNPVSELAADSMVGAALIDYFAGLVTEMKGASIPVGPNAVNFSVRQPFGVVARILAFNHPFLFCAGKIAAPLAAGNVVIVKPSEQAPLSALRFAELVDGLLPPGVLNIVTGGSDTGAALAAHPKVAKISLVGSAAAGRAVMREASATLKPVLLELGGKNALIAYPDADPDEVAKAMIAGMNFAWCGQSCGSTSRAFVHADIHDAVLSRVCDAAARYQPGDPSNPATTMGALISQRQHERVLGFIESARAEGGRLICGGGVPGGDLASGLFVEPTVFADITPDMRLAREEVFGPVLGVLKWSDEAAMIEAVNAVDYGLTCSIWTRDLDRAHRTAMAVETGYVWINETSRHILGAPFGGMKQSGIGREECLEELLAFTQEKNIYIALGPRAA